MDSWIQFIVMLILAYLIGSIPTSVWIGKLFFKKDIRDYGSGNAGATNTIRVLGYVAGIPVLLFDIFKAWLPVYASMNWLYWSFRRRIDVDSYCHRNCSCFRPYISHLHWF